MMIEEDKNRCTLPNDQLIEACKDWISHLCKTGGQCWSLQVPVNFNKDPDMLFGELIKRFESARKVTGN